MVLILVSLRTCFMARFGGEMARWDIWTKKYKSLSTFIFNSYSSDSLPLSRRVETFKLSNHYSENYIRVCE